ncbi:ABC transporter permease [Rhizobium puerariae]|uniref:ABC transporter permease n=1 Tax=Rhizobium puerariae TaxID=1585791 RepID=A0ABV6AJI5_9HYPH
MNDTAMKPDDRSARTRTVALDAYRIVPLGVRQSGMALALGLAVCLLLILMVASSPYEAFTAFVTGTFESRYSFGTMIAIATVLGITALGSALGFRAGVFNMGPEGQILVGGLTAALVAIYAPGPGWLVVILALLLSAVAGALWILIPVALRVGLRCNELLTTLMMNYVAASVTLFLVNTYFRDPEAGSIETLPIPPDRWLLRWLPPSNANVGVILLIVLAVAIWFWLSRTRSGMRMEAMGLQPAFAQYLGIPANLYLVCVMLGSGALSGLAGGVAILGISHVYQEGFSPQYGFLGLTVALIGRLHPFGVVAAAVLYSILITGATAMQTMTDVPFALVYVLQGVLILLVTSQRIARAQK